MPKTKNHLWLNQKFIYYQSEGIKENPKDIAMALFPYATDDKSIYAPVIFSLDKKIFFHGGDYLPFSYLPMPFADNQDFINQYPGVREVNFVPLLSCIIPASLLKKIKIEEFEGEDFVKHGDFMMTAQELGYKIKVVSYVRVTYVNAYRPKVGRKKFVQMISSSLKNFIQKWGAKLDARYKYPIVFHSILSYGGGYNLHAYNFAKTLLEKGIRVFYHFIGGTNEDERPSESPFLDDLKSVYGSNKLPQITLVHGTNNFKNSGSYKIAYTTTEVDGIPNDWVQCLNEMDEVWVTSEFVKKSFLRSGVLTPIFVIYEGVDPNYYHPDILPFFNRPKKRFLFFSNFAWGRRKGVDVLFEAFRKEFSEDEDVGLVLKVLPSYLGHNIKEELKLVYDRKGSAPVYIYDIEVPKWEMGRFYTMCDAFVWPSRGEGFGIPPLEALACGLPVIASNYSAHLEFLTKDGKPLPGVELVSGKVVPYPGGDSLYYRGFNWFEPSVDDLRKKMRMVYENYKDYKEKALKTSEYIRKNWSWSVSVEKAVERIKSIYKLFYNITYD